ncbi:MAG: DUF4256 domain-containing protein [Acidobacteria bacterium]|nr:DUF4256 domain-containing protein [Acidobacteriota bacterium]
MAGKNTDTLIQTLKARFESHPKRHAGISWGEVQERLEARPAALKALAAMEASGGEPDVIGREGKAGPFLFCDCAPESPTGRRSLCYDGEALAARKENRPKGSACESAASLGVELLDEAQYRALQALGEFDRKTSSWLRTPTEIRALGGAIFGDRRYNQVFIYHNGADSYYAARGYRGLLKV